MIANSHFIPVSQVALMDKFAEVSVKDGDVFLIFKLQTDITNLSLLQKV